MTLLAYDQTGSFRRRLVRRRLLHAFLLLTVAKLVVNECGDRVWTTVLSHFWQERCLQYQLPEDRIAFLAAPSGMQLPAYLGNFTTGSTWNGIIGAAPYPTELAEYQKLSAKRNGIPWDNLPAPIFLHGLRDAKGNLRLVTVYALANNPHAWWTLVATTRDPLDLRGQQANALVSTASWPMPGKPNDLLAVFAGQVVAKDLSCFTCRVVLNGSMQTVTGVLKEDGHVEFTPSSGLSPWSTKRTGPLQLPPLPQPTEGCDNILLPND